MPIIDSKAEHPGAPRGKPEAGPEFFSLQVREAKRFYLDLAPPATVALAVVSGGYERCAPDYAIHRPSFPYYSIEFVARGTGQLRLGQAEFALSPGAVFSYGPGISQDIATHPADPLTKYFVDFTGTRAEELLRQFAPTLGSTGRVSTPGEIQEIFDKLIENGQRATRFSAALCATLVEFLMLKIAECQTPAEAAQTPAFATYERCRRHIQTHYARLKTLADAARQCHVDPAYLCRLFRRYAQQSPYQFLMRLKMNLAADRLQDPGMLVKKVAAELGFDDPFHFSRAFKQVFGVSPEAFRRLR
jgi:AraC-like DNA-binding protein